MLTEAARATIPITSPLKDGGTTTADFVAFEGVPDGAEHVALVFPAPQENGAVPVVRVHSECLTGDVFHSQRCDCGPQLAEAIACMEQAGGILIYLRQEGRGIGLANKLKAYRLQDEGADTYEANRALGLAEDARDFEIAAEMLKALDVKKVRLLTNNPAKVEGLEAAGVTVVERIGTREYLTPHNAAYLKAKADHGHLFVKTVIPAK